MIDPPAAARRESSFFGRRKGKTLRAYQAGLMETLLPNVRVDLSAPVANPSALFSGAPDDLRLEVGFGGGEHLAADALSNPGRGYIGCEPFVNGVAKLMAQIAAQDLRNIRVHPGDAGDMIDALPAASLSGACILYADPWPKRRHRERRFVSDQMLTRLARVMRSGAELRFASDIDDYVGWTLARILRSPDFVWPAQSEAEWLAPWPEWSGTRYEAKALLEGRRPVYLTFIRR
ncbi:tRNA (guanine-N7-)-methyltransferase [Rhodoblastus sphagnicola]|uniref:tRNA (guanine(46)-N(7))-methyltransferase TrmB n=1 Tax=Rhodoblastus sphagnicola TaxID=333368 RepID=UPI00161D4257|nr:tRNA (guanine(46)-N(7))-methyltransferase TrmB [Rhodoblastus sphagnicola]MBB4197015.1 tRNA (guanine-N7-)-methyltransferase [Rhodoblastus sphagnicola]